jgi:Zn-dependent protease
MNFDLPSMLYSLPAVVLGLTAHEFMHAWAAFRLGDDTAREQGRLSLNPLRHIDPLGFLFLVVAGFGWAKPVQFNREKLKRPRRDEALIALAGPFSNLLLAVLASVALRLLALAVPGMAEGGAGRILFNLFMYLIYINYGLFVFNLIPIPPLDGSHLVFSALPMSPQTQARIYRFGTLALFAILIIDSRTRLDLLPIGKVVRAIAQAVFSVLGF